MRTMMSSSIEAKVMLILAAASVFAVLLVGTSCEICEAVFFDRAYVTLNNYPVPGDASDQRCGDLTMTFAKEDGTRVFQQTLNTCSGAVTAAETSYLGEIDDWSCEGSICEYYWWFESSRPSPFSVNVQLDSNTVDSDRRQVLDLVAREHTCNEDALFFTATLDWSE